MTVVPPTTYAPIPHALICTQPAPLVRLWGMLHWLEWRDQAYEIEHLAHLCETTDRTVYRWLEALHAAGWLRFDRQPGSKKLRLDERITLFQSPNEDAEPAKPLTSGSETSDISVKGSKPLTSGSETSDISVKGLANSAHQDAMKHATQTPDQTPESGGGGGDQRTPQKTPTSPPPPAGYPESRQYLIEHGAISEPRIAAAAALPLPLLEKIHTASLRDTNNRQRAIGRTLVRAALAAEDPAKAAAIAAEPELSEPEPDRKEPRNEPQRRSSRMGSGRGRVPIEAAQPAPHLSDGSEPDDDPDAAEAEGAAWAARHHARISGGGGSGV